ncbi:DNA-deoxyinosine glycosylase [Mycobacterium xenopi]|uniref:DNA-deoxyinosine glycosylase n=2 Tax=Mycobacterium xenopi TaxID=1789 RepID=A0AAD1GYL6_MYCXE|nr:DNA-deoxyinosine glycosylase [Mycobacterium xenopi]EUA50166.1 DNA-deoxyinosine glycosylase [Mycobacterium xenopi 3993]EUA73432.1 DNA-deoxyinosine glycosylase [Mycobacterium xenopi 4042]MDA3638898.1 DNA-deoxyinosine glycosylase [Mycobacterium xenopi]MDA3656996.1 DNA-deoxyinosine glycosylase [Mycobacterium xenopi]MDA3662145.1 DNA-deoxyinosine glycosylase [Mycobacterium xenopi]
MTTPLLEGLPPAVARGARLLILGSFPSAQSLAARQYYANPRNTFWRLTGELFEFDYRAAYERRLAALQSHGVALWDVLHKCRRIGSSDAKIDPRSVVVNDFAELFANHPTITRVYFNGEKAATMFRRLVHVDTPVNCRRLPSTSPANTIAFDTKLAAWQVISLS